jgi:peptidoglycan/xylan/chitin deacetylase (PgdA/CDA1 family)
MLVSVTRRRLIGGAAGGLLLAVCGGRGALAAATTGHPRMPTVRPTLPSREFFIPYTERPIGNGGLAAGQVALTFDDGPHAGLTPLVLDTLKRYGVRATFFVIGKNAAANPDLVRRMLAEGHSVGTHSWSHPYLTSLGDEQARTEVVRAQDTVQGIDAGGLPFFRLPYGAGLRKPALLKTLTDLGLYNFYWNMDPNESSTATPAVVLGRCLAEVRRARGGTLLLHDAHRGTVGMLPDLLEAFMRLAVETVVYRVPPSCPAPPTMVSAPRGEKTSPGGPISRA